MSLQNLRRNIWHKRNYFLLFLCIYAFMIGIFAVTSIGTEAYRLFLHMRQYIPAALTATVGVYFWQKARYPKRTLCPYVLIALGWILIYNILSYTTFYETATNLNNYKDIAFGAYAFGFLLLLRVFIGCFVKKRILTSVLFAGLQVLFLAIPLLEIMYYHIYGTVLSTPAAIAILQTNPHEAWEYLLQNVGISGVIGGTGLFFALFVFFSWINSQGNINEKLAGISFKTRIAVTFFLVASGGYMSGLFMETGVMESMSRGHQYLAQAEKFTEYHTENFKNLQVQLPSQKFSRPSTIILVIGESAGRNFMSVYGYTNNDTTPWWREAVSNDPDHFLRFNHAYSSFGSTVQSLEMALTEKNQYNQKTFSQSLTILDLAKKAGYKTYWFSNQSIKNAADTPIQLVARTADVHEWIDELPENQGRILYDGDLLPCLEQVNPDENNFVVLHVMGSHELTQHRYPPEFTRFSQNGKFDLVANYEDSMAYDDWVMQNIFTYAQEHLHLQAMIFFSDHGANPYRKRTADHIPFINVRIPLLIYLSDEYEELYPETTKTLKTHEDQYFTNDLMYELVGGILHLQSDHIPKTSNFADSSYQFTRDTLKTDLGKKYIRDDVDENVIVK